MRVSIEPRGGYLLAELRGRESARDMKEFLLAVKAACLEHGCPRILVSIRESHPMFKAEDYGLAAGGGYAAQIASPACRLALLGDDSELHHAHEYIEIVARAQRLNVRAFREHGAALHWLLSSEDLVADPLQGAAPRGADFKRS